MQDFNGARWYKCDLHLHTTASKCFQDREVTAQQWVDRAIEQGLDCVAVTDHNSANGIEAIQEITLSGVATKQDISDLKQDVSDLKQTIVTLENKVLKFLIGHAVVMVTVMVSLAKVL